MQVERVDFVSFLTQDIPRAKRFYSDVLGLEIETEGESDMEFRCRSGDARHLRSVEHRAAVRADAGRAGAAGAGRRRSRAELEAKGVAFDGETIDTASADMAWFKDPDGNALMLHRRYDA